MASQLTHGTMRATITLLALASVILIFSADVVNARTIESSSLPSARRSKLLGETSGALDVNDSDSESTFPSSEGGLSGELHEKIKSFVRNFRRSMLSDSDATGEPHSFGEIMKDIQEHFATDAKSQGIAWRELRNAMQENLDAMEWEENNARDKAANDSKRRGVLESSGPRHYSDKEVAAVARATTLAEITLIEVNIAFSIVSIALTGTMWGVGALNVLSALHESGLLAKWQASQAAKKAAGKALASKVFGAAWSKHAAKINNAKIKIAQAKQKADLKRAELEATIMLKKMAKGKYVKPQKAGLFGLKKAEPINALTLAAMFGTMTNEISQIEQQVLMLSGVGLGGNEGTLAQLSDEMATVQEQLDASLLEVEAFAEATDPEADDAVDESRAELLQRIQELEAELEKLQIAQINAQAESPGGGSAAGVLREVELLSELIQRAQQIQAELARTVPPPASFWERIGLRFPPAAPAPLPAPPSPPCSGVFCGIINLFSQYTQDAADALSEEDLARDGEAQIARIQAEAEALEEEAAQLEQSEVNSRVRRVFELFDMDASGSISKSELEAALLSVNNSPSEAEIASAIAQADSNGDGMVTRVELAQLVRDM